MADAGLNVSLGDIPYALMIPVAGMVVGLILSTIVFRKPKTYETKDISGANASPYTKKPGYRGACHRSITRRPALLISDFGSRRDDYGGAGRSGYPVCQRCDEA